MKSFDSEITLAEAKKRFLSSRMKRAKIQAEKQWEQSIGPKINDFLSGMTVNEVAKKHHIGRTDLYAMIRELGLPTRTRESKVLANIIMKNKRKHETEFRRMLTKCDCFSCTWIKKRLASFDKYGDGRFVDFGRY